MRILVGDYTGHPFQVQLSRALARRGHDVLHLFSASFQTPKGELRLRPDDPSGLQIVGVSLDEPFDKDNFRKRWQQESAIGKLMGAEIERFRPDVSILSNQTMNTLAGCVPAMKRVGSKFVFWIQDLVGEATSRILSKKLGLAGAVVGGYLGWREGRFLRGADHVVAIADDFVPILTERLRVPKDRVTVIENWSPLDDIPPLSRDNDWASANLPAGLRIVYSGTLGFKHDPLALLALAAGLPRSQMIIFSEGAAANRIAEDARARGIANLSVRPWLDFAELPMALAGADLLVVLLEPDAGIFSVPSKVLTYMCAGRPILASMAAENLAARIIARTGAGSVCPPESHALFVAAARALADDPTRRAAAGAAARAYAEATFAIGPIADRFEAIIRKVTA